jgi:hypothetical protein
VREESKLQKTTIFGADFTGHSTGFGNFFTNLPTLRQRVTNRTKGVFVWAAAVEKQL